MKTVSDIFSCNRMLKKEQGFTLLELMVSVSIIALVFVAIFRMQSGTIRLAESSRFYTMAPVLAEEVLAQLVLESEAPGGGAAGAGKSDESYGDFSEQCPGITWTCQVTDVSWTSDGKKDQAGQIPANAKGLKKIVIGIAQADKRYEITTFRYVPL